MSVLVKGMEMPKKKNGAVLIVYPDGRCAFENGKEYKAVPVPPHGRLIDADVVTNAAMEDILEWEDVECDMDGYRAFLSNYIEDAPTVIEAEEGET